MNPILVRLILVLLILVFGYLIFRFSIRQSTYQSARAKFADGDIWLRSKAPLQATVLKKEQTIHPDAQGIAKVDLELELKPGPDRTITVKTCWLVEIPNLAQLEPGKTVPVKFNPRRPQRVYPAVPWARAWLF